MKHLIFILTLLLSFSCSSEQKVAETQPIYIMSIYGGEPERLSLEYLDINLGSAKGVYKAINSEVAITDEKGKVMEFANSTEFLNHMASGGYEMISQAATQYGSDYTFKKKTR